MSSGQILVYIGESAGGCTADFDFFEEVGSSSWEFLRSKSQELTNLKINFEGLNDRVYVYRKI